MTDTFVVAERACVYSFHWSNSQRFEEQQYHDEHHGRYQVNRFWTLRRSQEGQTYYAWVCHDYFSREI
jgi:hypothetical protein